MGLPEMLELQASYDEAVQELRGLEVERETLLFQVDVLQDTLEGVEELLAEAQREAGEATKELQHEKEAKRKLEGLVCSLMQEVERLKEEGSNKPHVPVDMAAEATRRGLQTENNLSKEAPRAENECPNNRGLGAEDAEGQGEGSVEEEEEGSVLTKLQKVVNKALGHTPSFALDNLVSEDGVLQRPFENGIGEGQDLSPDTNDSDSISAYEDASAETPELDRIFPGDASELPDDAEDKEKSPTDNNHQASNGETQDPKNPDACILS